MKRRFRELKTYLSRLFSENENDDNILTEESAGKKEKLPDTDVKDGHDYSKKIYSKTYDLPSLILCIFIALPLSLGFAVHLTRKNIYFFSDRVFESGYGWDTILVTLLSWIFLTAILYESQKIVFPMISLIILILLTNQVLNRNLYGIMNLIDVNVKELEIPDNPGPVIKSKYISHPEAFEKAIRNSRNQFVRNFAVKASTVYFNDDLLLFIYGENIRYFSIYKYVGEKWKYVHDPINSEYYSTANETIENGLAGDCDDYTILMTSLINAVRGEVRIIITRNHMFPVVKVGEKSHLRWIESSVKELFPESKLKDRLNYHVDGTDVWLNFDLDEYPGASDSKDKVIDTITMKSGNWQNWQ